MLSNRRLLIVAEEGAEAQVILCDHTAGSTAYLHHGDRGFCCQRCEDRPLHY
jgi:hypothetical protein